MESSHVPRHVGIIMDGNRRFAKRLMAKPWKGHEWGAEKTKKVMESCERLGIKELTLYTLSIENFNRPKEEFEFLMALFRTELNNFLQPKCVEDLKKRGLRILFIGRLQMFPSDIQVQMKKVMDMTKENKVWRLNLAMAYGGRSEVIDAVRKIALEMQKGTLSIDAINEDSFKEFLYMPSEPDLIIRTGGEKRTSNFLPYQGAYAEWIFVDKFWPEFEDADFVACINEFSNRERRFGK